MDMRKILSLIIIIFTLFASASCRQDNVSPIRNVRFDPKLLNPIMGGSTCTNYNYYYGNQPRSLGTAYIGKVIVVFTPNLTHNQQQQVISNYGFVEGITGQVANESGMLHTLSLMAGLNCKQVEQAMKELAKDNSITYVAPYFLVNDSELIGLSNELMVTTNNVLQLKRLASACKATLVNDLGNNTYLLSVDKNSKGNALETANYLKKQNGIEHAEPDFIVSL
jgi:hypothetical protein